MQVNRYDKSLRLSSADFSATFQSVDHSIKTKHFTFLLSKAPNDEGGLGLVIAKKKVRFAVQRNTCKRILREFYRQADIKQKLSSFRIVVIATSYANQASKEALWTSLNNFIAKFDA